MCVAPSSTCVCVWVGVCLWCFRAQMRQLCNALRESYQCSPCLRPVNTYALQRDTHSGAEINIPNANHHLWFQQQTQTQICLTVLIRCSTDINASGVQASCGSLSPTLQGLNIVNTHPPARTHACVRLKHGHARKHRVHRPPPYTVDEGERGMSFWMVSRCGAWLSQFCH